MNTISRAALAASTVAAAAVLAACGSTPSTTPAASGPSAGTSISAAPTASDGRPSEEQILAAISKPGNAVHIPVGRLTKTQLSCVAKVIEDSKLSNAALQAVVAGNAHFDGGSSDNNAVDDIAASLRHCAR